MDFRELAIREHHKAELAAEAWRQEQSADFAKKAARIFNRRISEVAVSVAPIDPRCALLVIDGIKVVAREECGGVEFFMDVTCCHCEWESPIHTPTLADIGKAIEGLFECSHCTI